MKNSGIHLQKTAFRCKDCRGKKIPWQGKNSLGPVCSVPHSGLYTIFIWGTFCWVIVASLKVTFSLPGTVVMNVEGKLNCKLNRDNISGLGSV